MPASSNSLKTAKRLCAIVPSSLSSPTVFTTEKILSSKKPLFSADVCQALEIVQEMHNELKNYECTQEFYDSRKKEMIERYSAFPLTMFNTSSLTEKERFDRRLAVMRAILDAETTKNKKDEN